MPFKILLADHGMTAQKMARDILSKEGYEVIVCSNGAVAAKKLADKPDLLILDVYMPGYTGLELCEKVRATPEIAKTPVLLTVGKMEPYNPADGQRVGADGVLVKPFEATDLLAAVKRFEAAAAPAHDKTAVFQAPAVEEFKDQSYQEWKESTGEFNVAELQAKGPAKTEVPSDVGAAPAFADMDMMGGAVDPNAATMEFAAVASSTSFDETVTVPPPVKPAPSMGDTVTFDHPIMQAPPPTAVTDAPPALPAEFGFDMPAAVTPVEAAKFDELIATPTVVPDVPMLAPEPVASVAPAKDSLVEFTSAPRAGHVEIEVEHGLEQAMETAPEDFVPAPDPSLVTDRTQMASEFATKFGSEKEEDAGFVKGFEKPEVEIAPVPAGEQLSQAEIDSLKGGAAAPAFAEAAPAAPAADDFEARVAAAMSGFDDSAPPPVEFAPVMEAAPPAPVEVPPVMEAAPPPPPPVEETPVYERTQKIQIPVEAMEEPPAPPEPEPEPAPQFSEAQQVPEGMADASLVEQMQAAFKDLPVENVPVEEPPPPAPEPEVETSTLAGIGAVAAAAIAGVAMTQQKEAVMIPEPPPAPAPISGPDMELAAQLAAAVGGEMSSAPVLTDASGKPVARHDRRTVTLTVQRVMERMLPRIMDEVSKELEEEEKK